MKAFRRMRQIFDAPDLVTLTRGRRTARTHMLLEQISWAAFWLPKYDPEDYPRIRQRMVDILLHGLAVDGAAWEPRLPPMADLAPGEGQEMSRDAFLRAATRLINTHGYRGASVDRISAELNVTKGSFYHHIDAKDDLVVACFERSYEVMRRVQRLVMSKDGDQWTKLASAGPAKVTASRPGPSGWTWRTRTSRRSSSWRTRRVGPGGRSVGTERDMRSAN